MKKIIFWVVGIGLLVFFIFLETSSFESKGLRRFEVLNNPSKEILVGVCWPFSVNQDGMRYDSNDDWEDAIDGPVFST